MVIISGVGIKGGNYTVEQSYLETILNRTMADKYIPNYHKINEIYLKEIVFEKSIDHSEVSIFGYYFNSDKKELIRIDYLCEFSALTDLLIFANEKGEPIIEAITEKLNSYTEEYPIVIDIENIYGEPLKIENILLTIYLPFEENEKGEWIESTDKTFYIIDSVESWDLLDQALDNMSTETPESKLSELHILLNNAYLFYEQLLGIGISKKTARKQSGLKDELLFRIAYLNNCITDKNSFKNEN